MVLLELFYHNLKRYWAEFLLQFLSLSRYGVHKQSIQVQAKKAMLFFNLVFKKIYVKFFIKIVHSERGILVSFDHWSIPRWSNILKEYFSEYLLLQVRYVSRHCIIKDHWRKQFKPKTFLKVCEEVVVTSFITPITWKHFYFYKIRLELE